jgi:hypothetical protein
MKKIAVSILGGLALAGFGLMATAQAQSAKEMTFFLTSVGPGNGGNLGGISTFYVVAVVKPFLPLFSLPSTFSFSSDFTLNALVLLECLPVLI